jgi:hypothetical protein
MIEIVNYLKDKVSVIRRELKSKPNPELNYSIFQNDLKKVIGEVYNSWREELEKIERETHT